MCGPAASAMRSISCTVSTSAATARLLRFRAMSSNSFLPAAFCDSPARSSKGNLHHRTANTMESREQNQVPKALHAVEPRPQGVCIRGIMASPHLL